MPLHALRAVAIISFQFVIIDQMLAVADGITLRTDLKDRSQAKPCVFLEHTSRVAVGDGSGSAWLAQRHTTSFFFSRASSRKRALIAANRPGGMNP